MKIKNMTMETTPVIELDVIHENGKEQKMRAYWSKNTGLYGNQVGWLIFHNNNLVAEGISRNCGTCPLSFALSQFVRHIGLERLWYGSEEPTHLLHDYKVGGNYYRLTIDQFAEVLRGKLS